MILSRLIEQVVRSEGRRVLAGLIRLTRDFDAAEDALQEAYARALVVWRRDGVPDRPAAWLNTVARRVAIDQMRRHRRAGLPPGLEAAVVGGGPDPDEDVTSAGIEDDRLRLLFVCCHPALSPDAQCALALRTLGGLTTREIAKGLLEAESTTAQRLVRAKKKIRDARIPFEIPAAGKLDERTGTVLSVLYLIFNEGYASTDAPALMRPDLAGEAIRLTRLTVELLPTHAEARGLLALMLLTDARRPARLTSDGDLVPLDEQDRSRWNRTQIEEGVRVLDEALALGPGGPYQTQAAIAALHDTAPSAAATDWMQIAALYRSLLRMLPTPVVELNAAVALGLATHLDRALEWMSRIAERSDLAGYYLLPASRADVLRRLGRFDEAAEAYREAIALVINPAEKRYLQSRLTQLPAASFQLPASSGQPDAR